jgi:predicted unusual protein kinase regulating ubiquinone biosynthesis (AarF/ABC1/UbiB family)
MLRARYFRIVFFFARVCLELLAWEVVMPWLGLRGLARRTRAARLTRIAVRFRALAIRMGGVLIKVGQFLSARLDVLPSEITTELAGLQDEVPPEAFEAVQQLAEAELGMPLDRKFAAFERTPLAAASLGQVHRANLCPDPALEPGELNRVVVKIQRPNIETIIQTDLAALRAVGGWLHRYPPIRRRADVPALLAEFSRTLYEEIDYLAEGRNAETFAANFRHRPGVCVPRVVWTHTTRRVLTLEDVFAIKINDYTAITAAGVDRAAVAQRLFATYWQQIIDDSFFHADPHPGNLFITVPEAAEDWTLTFVDFGMVGRVAPNVRTGIREMALAVGTRDAPRLVKAYQTLGVLLPSADLELLERAEIKAFDRFWGKSMTELRSMDRSTMLEFASEFSELLYDLPFQVPEDMILLGRTAAILSGMCTGLDREFNFWQSLMPFVERLVADETVTGWRFYAGELETLARVALVLPKRTDAMLSRLEQGKLEVRTPELSRQVTWLELATRRLAGSVIFAALLLGGIQLYLAREPALAAGLLAGAGASLLWVLLAARRRRG